MQRNSSELGTLHLLDAIYSLANSMPAIRGSTALALCGLGHNFKPHKVIPHINYFLQLKLVLMSQNSRPFLTFIPCCSNLVLVKQLKVEFWQKLLIKLLVAVSRNDPLLSLKNQSTYKYFLSSGMSTSHTDSHR